MRRVASYINSVRHVVPEFWEPERVLQVRRMAQTGQPVFGSLEPSSVGRLLDRLRFKDLGAGDLEEAVGRSADVDVSVTLNGTPLSIPIYVGDMSFGALSGNPNIAIARAATEAGGVAGIGEGGLHPEVAKHRNIVVQWASARFGMDMDLLRAGLAVNIKIGQGAKPGIGGHLPGKKVVDVIASLRKIPVGSEAISPAPHHDIYSIEDLAQRVKALRDLTGKPVLVKVASVNKIHYVAVGVARSTAEGIIIDGAGAGTGAAPVAVNEHAGIPIDYAVPAVDQWLRRDGRREGFLMVGGGMLYSPLDVAKIIALGADMANLGTASLLAMGCTMCHVCHTGGCPTALTNMIGLGKELDIDWAAGLLRAYLEAVGRGLRAVLYALGMDRLEELRGRRDLLELHYADEGVAEVVGVELASKGHVAWFEKNMRVYLHREYYETLHPPLTGMGGVVPGYTSPARRPLDLLRIEASQVTHPSADPYREEVDSSITVGGFVFDTPIVTPVVDEAAAPAAYALGSPIHGGCDYGEYCLSHYRPTIIPADPDAEVGGGVVVLDEGLGGTLEEAVSTLDRRLRAEGRRARVTIVGVGELYNAADVYKLGALGADLVAPMGAFRYVHQKVKDLPRRERRTRYENLISTLTMELKVLMGAGGITSYQHSLVGNRDALRSLDGEIARRLGVEVAGK